MEEHGWPGRDVAAPYFFLSYARMPRDGYDTMDPDFWVQRFFRDLSEHILQLTDVSGRPGFMDSSMRTGQLWNDEMARSLSACRVFVPLYSPRYFVSSWCGKEWAAFQRRQVHYRRHEDHGPSSAVVPVLWAPVPEHQLPDSVRSVQYVQPEIGRRYEDFGLYGLLKVSSFRRDYERAVLHIARSIVEVAENVVVERGDGSAFDTAYDAFAARPPRTRRVRISVAAGTRDGLPEGRSPDYYGPTPLDWNPFHPDSTQPVAQVAAEIVERLDYRAEVREFDDTAVADEVPEILLLDRWVLRDPEYRKRLGTFDGGQRSTAGLMVPWNEADPDSAEAGDELVARTESTLPRHVARGQQAAVSAVSGVPDERSFSAVLPRVVAHTMADHLKRVSAAPPTGKSPPRFRLLAPGPESDRPQSGAQGPEGWPR
nr:TIR-like protein FxsC [Streptomyces antibioticus]